MCKDSPDMDAVQYAKINKISLIPFEVTKKEWNELGKKAGPLRNQKMADYADCGIGFWDGKSKGTKDMEARLVKAGKKVILFNVEK